MGDDWKGYAGKAQLDAAHYFWWFDSAGRNVNDYVALVQDPEISNTTQYITGVGVQDASGSYLRYAETLLPGSAADFGAEITEWSDGEWYEYVVHYKKTGSSSALYRYYRRRLTSGGRTPTPSGSPTRSSTPAGPPATRFPDRAWRLFLRLAGEAAAHLERRRHGRGPEPSPLHRLFRHGLKNPPRRSNKCRKSLQ